MPLPRVYGWPRAPTPPAPKGTKIAAMVALVARGAVPVLRWARRVMTHSPAAIGKTQVAATLASSLSGALPWIVV